MAEEYSGFKQPFRIWLYSGTPMLLAGGDRINFVVHNEGGPDIRIGNVTGAALASQGYLLVSGATHEDMFSDDEWWAIQSSGLSGSVSGYIVRQQ